MQLHQIIEEQYKIKMDNMDSRNWFLNESVKMFKGYTKPTTYLNNIMNGNVKKIEDETPPIYLEK